MICTHAAGQPVLKQLLSGYKATADWPAVTFYKELMELYPNAKVSLAGGRNVIATSCGSQVQSAGAMVLMMHSPAAADSAAVGEDVES